MSKRATAEGLRRVRIRNADRDTAGRKRSHAVPCSSAFRDAALALAARRRVNVGDLARSVLLTLPGSMILDFPDPGEPDPDDRETVVLKSGPNAGKPWRRKPRLQVRLPGDESAETIRRALALAIALDEGRIGVALEDGRGPGLKEQLAERGATIDRLQAVVKTLAFTPLKGGVRNRADALHVLGFPPDSQPDTGAVNARFRMLATVHHPDSGHGDHERMAQLNDAVRALRPGRT